MGVHEETHKVLDNKELVKRIYQYNEIFGNKPTRNKFGISRWLVEKVVEAYEKHKTYFTESEEDGHDGN